MTATQQIVLHVTQNIDDNNIVIGPLVWRLSDDGKKQWYFAVSASEKGRGFRTDAIDIGPGIDPHEARQSTILDFARHRNPALAIHDTDDELYAIRLCESLWPGERVTRLRQAIEAEREQANSPH